MFVGFACGPHVVKDRRQNFLTVKTLVWGGANKPFLELLAHYGVFSSIPRPKDSLPTSPPVWITQCVSRRCRMSPGRS